MSYQGSPFIPPVPSPHRPRGVIPSPVTAEEPLPEQPHMRPMHARGHSYGSYRGHSPVQWTPQGQWPPPPHHGYPPAGMPGVPHSTPYAYQPYPPGPYPPGPYGQYPPGPPPGGPPGHYGYPPGPYPPGPPNGHHQPYPPHNQGRHQSHSAAYPPGPLPGYGSSPYAPYPPMGGSPYGQYGQYPWMPHSAPHGHGPLPFDGIPRPVERPEDDIKIDRWAIGTQYSPVLTPFQVAILDVKLEINPFLAPPGDNPPPDKPFLEYNVLLPINTAHRSIDGPRKSWSIGRAAPATSPRVSKLRVICSHFPWLLEIKASDIRHGVTCIDVIRGIHDQLHDLVPKQQVEMGTITKGEAWKRKLYSTYYYNRSTARDAPGGSVGDGIRRMDWLIDNVRFDGLSVDEKFVRDALGISGPGWKGLNDPGDEEKKETTPRERLQGWPATIILHLDQRYNDEGDRESVMSTNTAASNATDATETTGVTLEQP